jgi:hypothetical protein
MLLVTYITHIYRVTLLVKLLRRTTKKVGIFPSRGYGDWCEDGMETVSLFAKKKKRHSEQKQCVVFGRSQNEKEFRAEIHAVTELLYTCKQ